jgi:hypothetical protein
VSRHPLGRAKATARAAPSAPSRPMTPPRSQRASETSRPDCLQPRASSPFTPSAPRVTDPHLRHRRSAPFGIVEGGLRNNPHITRVASALSLNHHRTLHQTNRSRTRTETNHRAGRGMTLPKTISPIVAPRQ